MASVDRNIDEDTVRGFGQEWAAYDQTAADRRELQAVFDAYFAVFP